MNVEIYADVVFLINFIMDFFIFWIVSRLIKRKTNFIRLCVGALVGSLTYCIIIFVPGLFNVFGIVTVLTVSIITCFTPKSLKEFGMLVLFTVASVFCVGGAGMALFSFVNLKDILGNILGLDRIRHFPFRLLLISSCSTFVLIKLFIAWYNHVIIKRQTFYELTIKLNEEVISLNALVDTGNSLHDPLSEDPVIIVEFETIKKFLPEPMKLIFYEKKENDLTFVTEHIGQCHMTTKLRMIPYSSLGKQNGMLIGLRVDGVTLSSQAGITTLNRAIVAIYNFQLSKDGFYHALLNPEIIPHQKLK